MSQITIRHCPVCSTIKERANEVAAALRHELGNNVNVVEGEKGQFIVEVDGQTVAGKTGDMLPTVDEVVSAVRRKTPTAAQL